MTKPPYIVIGTEFEFVVPGHPEPVAVIRRLRLQGRIVFRAVSWAPTSEARELIGYHADLDRVAEMLWRQYCDAAKVQHERASVTHGGAERHRS